MKIQLSSRQKIYIGLITTGVICLIIGTAFSLSDLMTVYGLTESIDVQDNSEIVQQLKDIEMRTQIYNAMKVIGILIAVAGGVLLYATKHNRNDRTPKI